MKKKKEKRKTLKEKAFDIFKSKLDPKYFDVVLFKKKKVKNETSQRPNRPRAE